MRKQTLTSKNTVGYNCCSIGLHMLQGTRIVLLMWKVSFYSITPKGQTVHHVCHCIYARDAKTTCGHMFGHMPKSLWTVQGELDALTALASRQSCAERGMTAPAVIHMTRTMLQTGVQCVQTQTNQSAMTHESHVITL